MTFIAILARLAAISDRELETLMPWPGLGSPGPERIETRWWLLFRTLEMEQAAVARARTTYRGTEAQRILGLAQVAYGDLRGLLAGVAAGQLDRAPREGEWSARETDRKSTRLNSSHIQKSRMPSSA